MSKALDLEERIDRALRAGDYREARQVAVYRAAERIVDRDFKPDKNEGPGRLLSPAPSTPEHPSATEAGRRSRVRVWHTPRALVDALVEGLGPLRGFRLTPLMEEALALRAAFLVGPAGLTEEEAAPIFSLPMYRGCILTDDIVRERCQNAAALAWMYLTEGRPPVREMP